MGIRFSVSRVMCALWCIPLARSRAVLYLCLMARIAVHSLHCEVRSEKEAELPKGPQWALGSKSMTRYTC